MTSVQVSQFSLLESLPEPSGVINYEVSGTARANSYGLEPVVYSRATCRKEFLSNKKKRVSTWDDVPKLGRSRPFVATDICTS